MMNNAQTIKQQAVTLNGLNIDQLIETIDAVKEEPSLAHFEFRAKNQWINGGENRSTIQGFYGVGVEDESREKPFVLTNGEPPVLLGNNEGANPVEFLLHALAGCLTTTIVLHAVARGIRIQELSSELVGTIDAQGLLGLDDTVPIGYKQINLKLHIKADCSDEELDDLLAFAKDHSPVCNTVCRPVPVTVERV
ncbi:MAG: OsmC family protein [Gammaproteobacteria bacterium]